MNHKEKQGNILNNDITEEISRSIASMRPDSQSNLLKNRSQNIEVRQTSNSQLKKLNYTDIENTNTEVAAQYVQPIANKIDQKNFRILPLAQQDLERNKTESSIEIYDTLLNNDKIVKNNQNKSQLDHLQQPVPGGDEKQSEEPSGSTKASLSLHKKSNQIVPQSERDVAFLSPQRAELESNQNLNIHEYNTNQGANGQHQQQMGQLDVNNADNSNNINVANRNTLLTNNQWSDTNEIQLIKHSSLNSNNFITNSSIYTNENNLNVQKGGRMSEISPTLNSRGRFKQEVYQEDLQKLNQQKQMMREMLNIQIEEKQQRIQQEKRQEKERELLQEQQIDKYLKQNNPEQIHNEKSRLQQIKSESQLNTVLPNINQSGDNMELNQNSIKTQLSQIQSSQEFVTNYGLMEQFGANSNELRASNIIVRPPVAQTTEGSQNDNYKNSKQKFNLNNFGHNNSGIIENSKKNTDIIQQSQEQNSKHTKDETDYLTNGGLSESVLKIDQVKASSRLSSNLGMNSLLEENQQLQQEVIRNQQLIDILIGAWKENNQSFNVRKEAEIDLKRNDSKSSSKNQNLSLSRRNIIKQREKSPDLQVAAVVAQHLNSQPQTSGNYIHNKLGNMYNLNSQLKGSMSQQKLRDHHEVSDDPLSHSIAFQSLDQESRQSMIKSLIKKKSKNFFEQDAAIGSSYKNSYMRLENNNNSKEEFEMTFNNIRLMEGILAPNKEDQNSNNAVAGTSVVPAAKPREFWSPKNAEELVRQFSSQGTKNQDSKPQNFNNNTERIHLKEKNQNISKIQNQVNKFLNGNYISHVQLSTQTEIIENKGAQTSFSLYQSSQNQGNNRTITSNPLNVMSKDGDPRFLDVPTTAQFESKNSKEQSRKSLIENRMHENQNDFVSSIQLSSKGSPDVHPIIIQNNVKLHVNQNSNQNMQLQNSNSSSILKNQLPYEFMIPITRKKFFA